MSIQTLIDLPFEIREQIYYSVFDKGEPYIPLSTVTIQGEYNSALKANIEENKGLGLLLTCKGVYEQAVEILYKSQTFCFSDKPFGDTPFDMDVSKDCRFCQMYERYLDAGVDTSDDHWKRCWCRNKNDEHPVDIPECSLASLDDWLSQIGPKNAARINKVELRFHSNVFTERWIKFGSFYRPRGSNDVFPCVGQHFSTSMSVLAKATNITELALIFTLPENNPWEDAHTHESESTLVGAFYNLLGPRFSLKDCFKNFSRLKVMTVVDLHDALNTNGSDEDGTEQLEIMKRDANEGFEALKLEIFSRNSSPNVSYQADAQEGSKGVNDADPDTKPSLNMNTQGLKATLDSRADEIGEALRKLDLGDEERE